MTAEATRRDNGGEVKVSSSSPIFLFFWFGLRTDNQFVAYDSRVDARHVKWLPGKQICVPSEDFN